jgi:hypothetical protein
LRAIAAIGDFDLLLAISRATSDAPSIVDIGWATIRDKQATQLAGRQPDTFGQLGN